MNPYPPYNRFADVGATQAMKQRRNFVCVKRREDFAEMITRGSAVAWVGSDAEEDRAPSGRTGNVDERLGSRQHREQTERQGLLERITPCGLGAGSGKSLK
jgi:hypothetical protein